MGLGAQLPITFAMMDISLVPMVTCPVVIPVIIRQHTLVIYTQVEHVLPIVVLLQKRVRLANSCVRALQL